MTDPRTPWPFGAYRPAGGDMRAPDIDETCLSQQEVLHGLRNDLIPEGPRARALAFRPAMVTVRQQVLVADIPC